VNEAMPAVSAPPERLALCVRYALSIGLDWPAATIDGLLGFADAAEEKQRIRSDDYQYRTLLRSPSSVAK
jgi:hypothetical protein